jgi:hypothetical protein
MWKRVLVILAVGGAMTVQAGDFPPNASATSQADQAEHLSTSIGGLYQQCAAHDPHERIPRASSICERVQTAALSGPFKLLDDRRINGSCPQSRRWPAKDRFICCGFGFASRFSAPLPEPAPPSAMTNGDQ